MSILYFKFVFPSFDYEYHLGEIVKRVVPVGPEGRAAAQPQRKEL